MFEDDCLISRGRHGETRDVGRFWLMHGRRWGTCHRGEQQQQRKKRFDELHCEYNGFFERPFLSAIVAHCGNDRDVCCAALVVFSEGAGNSYSAWWC